MQIMKNIPHLCLRSDVQEFRSDHSGSQWNLGIQIANYYMSMQL